MKVHQKILIVFLNYQIVNILCGLHMISVESKEDVTLFVVRLPATVPRRARLLRVLDEEASGAHGRAAAR